MSENKIENASKEKCSERTSNNKHKENKYLTPEKMRSVKKIKNMWKR